MDGIYSKTTYIEGINASKITQNMSSTTAISLIINRTNLESPLPGTNASDSANSLSNTKLIEIVVYMIIWLFGTIGTILVAYVVLTSRKIKSTTNTHLLNLALADLVYLQGRYSNKPDIWINK